MPSTAGVPEPETLILPGQRRTAVVDIGARDAPPIVLLHAVACTGLLTWYPSLSGLAERYRVVVFDQRWHGRGIRSNTFSLADCAEDVIAVADALGLGRFTIGGYSMGGLVGQLVAHSHADRIRGLVLCSTASSFGRGLRQRAALTVFGQAMRRLREQVPRRVERLSTREPRARLEDRRWALAEFRATSPWTIAAAIDEIGRFNSTGWLHRLRLPTSIVVTARDRFIAPAHQRSLARRIPGAATYEIAAGHAACVLQADQFVPALLAACSSVHARRAPGR